MFPPLPTSQTFPLQPQLLKRGLVDFDSQNSLAQRENSVDPRAALGEHDDVARFDVRVEEVAGDEFDGFHVHSRVAGGALVVVAAVGGEFGVQGLLRARGGEEEGELGGGISAEIFWIAFDAKGGIGLLCGCIVDPVLF